jgi:hypothetical protein
VTRLVVIAALVLVTASAAFAAARLSEPAYIKAATKICRQRTREAAALPKLPKGVSTRRVTTRLKHIVPIFQRAYSHFQALKVPHSLSYLVPRWLHEESRRLGALKQALAAGVKGNRNVMYGFMDRSTLYGASAIQQATDIGITGCL